ncbi:uncharacterized protein LOC122500028 [Leptopilina heterotoma]|uniref:uncharacterized protein LOC122500028 n=1 Tax=Leptopilina heterotoma TaxID=63436 RepID=UPI001CA8B33B|nr:uncharacterized protein LOC122500028 [Leptopilina heterotoma]
MMSRRGLMRRSSSSKHRPTEEFKMPEGYSSSPSLLDFPVHDSGNGRSLGTIPHRPHDNPGKLKEVEISGLEIVDPIQLPKATMEDTVLKRQEGESWEEFGSRLAVDELDRFVKFQDPKSSVAVEKLKEKQSEKIKLRNPVLRKEDIVHPTDDDEIEHPRPITPPGPPNRPGMDMLTTRVRGVGEKTFPQGQYEALPRKTTGTLFNDLESIPTDPTIDPPPRVCNNCWRKGHNRSKCPKPVTEAHCENCGRKYQTVATCPRCAKGYRKFLLAQAQGNSNKEKLSPKGDKEEEEVERRPTTFRRQGNPLLPTMWKAEINSSVDKDGHDSHGKAWNIPKTPSPPMTRRPILFTSGKKSKEEEAAEDRKRSDDLELTREDDKISKSSCSDNDDLPPPYESTREQAIPLVKAIQEVTIAMRGLPSETINLAIQQLIKERQMELEERVHKK